MCECDYTSLHDPRIRILRRTKSHREFAFQLFGCLSNEDVAQLRQVVIVMMNMSHCQRPDASHRRNFASLKSRLKELEERKTDLMTSRKGFAVELADLPTLAERKAVDLEFELHSQAKQEADTRRAMESARGHSRFSVIQAPELVSEKEMRADRFFSNLKYVRERKTIERDQDKVRNELEECKKQIQVTEASLVDLRARKQWTHNRTLAIQRIIYRKTDESILVAKVFEDALDYCALVLRSLVQLVISNKAAGLERYLFEDIRMCWHMCILAKYRYNQWRTNANALPSSLVASLHSPAIASGRLSLGLSSVGSIPTRSVRGDLLLPSSAETFIWFSSFFERYWTPKGICEHFPDERHDDGFTRARFYDEFSVLINDGCEGKNAVNGDDFRHFFDCMRPQKHQPKKGLDIIRDMLLSTADDSIVPLAITIQVFFSLGCYSDCTPAILPDHELEELLDLFARPRAISEFRYTPLEDFYVHEERYVVGMMATKEYINAIFSVVMPAMTSMSPQLEVYCKEIRTVCEQWRNGKTVGYIEEDVFRRMVQLKSDMADYGAVLRFPCGFWWMVERKRKEGKSKHANKATTLPLLTDAPITTRRSRKSRSAVSQLFADTLASETARSFPLDIGRREIDCQVIGARKGVNPTQANLHQDTNPAQANLHQDINPTRDTLRQCTNPTRANLHQDSGCRDTSCIPMSSSFPIILPSNHVLDVDSGLKQSHFLFSTDCLLEHRAALVAFICHEQTTVWESAVLVQLAVPAYQRRDFLMAWRFGVVIGLTIGMTPTDEAILLSLLIDFYCKRLGPSTIETAIKEACRASACIRACAVLWTSWVSVVQVSVPFDVASEQTRALQTRMSAFFESKEDYPDNMDYLLWCPNCGSVKSTINYAFRLGHKEPSDIHHATDVMGFSKTSIRFRKSKKVFCGRTGLATSASCRESECQYVPLCHRIVYKDRKAFTICPKCGIGMTISSFYTLYHSKYWAMCSACSLTAKYDSGDANLPLESQRELAV